MSDKSPHTEDVAEELERLAEEPSLGVVREFVSFLRHNKRWWLIPILLGLLLLGFLLFAGSSPVAPFIYTLF